MIPMKNIEEFVLDIEYGANDQTLECIMNCQHVKSFTWYLNVIDELRLVDKLTKNPIHTLTELKLYVVYGLKNNNYKRTQVLANVIEFMVHYKQLASIMVGFQLIDNNIDLFKEEKICCEKCSTHSDGDQSDDDDTISNERTNNLQVLETILESFRKIVEYKFNRIWTMNYWVQKMPDKLIPVMGKVYICANFRKKIH